MSEGLGCPTCGLLDEYCKCKRYQPRGRVALSDFLTAVNELRKFLRICQVIGLTARDQFRFDNYIKVIDKYLKENG